MLMTEIFALAAGGFCALFTTYVAFTHNAPNHKRTWLFPALLSVTFVGFSACAAATQGPFGFWTEHSARGLWGNQIWFDLLLMASIAWVLVVPRARKMGMSLPMWLVFVIGSGSIGFLVMMARLLYLEQRTQVKV